MPTRPCPGPVAPVAPDSQLLRIDELARLLRVSRRKASALLGAGEIPVVRLGRRCPRIRLADVARFLDARTSATPR